MKEGLLFDIEFVPETPTCKPIIPLAVKRCRRCNRPLKDAESIRCGMGKKCMERHKEYVEQFCISLFSDIDKKAGSTHDRHKNNQKGREAH